VKVERGDYGLALLDGKVPVIYDDDDTDYGAAAIVYRANPDGSYDPTGPFHLVALSRLTRNEETQ